MTLHRVALLLENRPEFFFHWLALNGLGVSAVPINPHYRRTEMEFLIRHSAGVVFPTNGADQPGAWSTTSSVAALRYIYSRRYTNITFVKLTCDFRRRVMSSTYLRNGESHCDHGDGVMSVRHGAANAHQRSAHLLRC